MEWNREEIQQRLEFYYDLLSCSGTVYGWVYQPDGTLVQTNCPDLVLDELFRRATGVEEVLANEEEHDKPLVLSVPLGLMWCVVYERHEGELRYIHVLGPIFAANFTMSRLEHQLATSPVSLRWKHKLVEILQRVPMLSLSEFLGRGIMLEYCISGRRLTTSDIAYHKRDWDEDKHVKPPVRDGMKTWMHEQALMKIVRDGDLNYQKVLQRSMQEIKGISILGGDNLTQARVSQIIFISQITRSAIEGGLSPERAYAQGDHGIQRVINATTLSELTGISQKLYEQFIHDVHDCRLNPNWSKQTQSCCDYIDQHVDQKITLAELAKRMGYTTYYLSHKFKQETGVSINDYIKNAKIERAKLLLTTTQDSIQDISDALAFSTRSFFADEFKRSTGIAPAAYREKHQIL